MFKTQLMHADELGSVTAITSDAGTLVKQSTYAPFGEAFDDNLGLDPAETKGFIGERFDADAGLVRRGNAPQGPFLIRLTPKRKILRPRARHLHPTRLV